MKIEEIFATYNLPAQEILAKELGELDEDEKDVLGELIDRLQSKTKKYTLFFEELLYPDSNIISMQESSMFSNEEREKLYSLFREVTLYQRKVLLINLSTENKEKADYFNEFYSFWQEKKDEVKRYVSQALEVWSTKEIPKITEGYFG